MNEEIVKLLEKVVEQNAKVLEQNHRFIDFLESRDGRLAERVDLEIEKLKDEVARTKQGQMEQAIADNEWARHPGALEEVVRESVRAKIRQMQQDKEWNEKHETKRLADRA
jgi:dTDP-D-glucose 4,6-dehydratase